MLIASPADLRGFIDLFGEHLELPAEIRRGMARRTASWFEMDWSQMEVSHWAGRELPPLLLFHDRDDRVVTWEHGERIRHAWGRAELITTEGLGHRRIRRSERVIRKTVDFLSANEAARPDHEDRQEPGLSVRIG